MAVSALAATLAFAAGPRVSAQTTAEYGLEWPGDGSVRRMLYWSDPFPIYDATYIFKVYPRKKSESFNYFTTFFWGNNGSFIWDGGNANTYYGAHPYPVPAPDGPGQWEISVAANDYTTGQEVEWNRWHTQAFRAWRESPTITHHEFYYDLPDTTKVIRHTVVDSGWADRNPPSPAIVMGQAPDLNGESWGGFPGWEEFNGVIRGIQIYSGLLSIDDILAEIDAPESTQAGQSLIWYLNLNPRPGDVTDKKGLGTPNDPLWDGTTALEWSSSGSASGSGSAAPTISAVDAGGVTSAGATISWSTDEPADSQVEFGTSSAYGQISPLDTALVTDHAVSLDGLLAAGTTYHYRVRSTDADGNTAVSADFTFTTTSSGTSADGPRISYGFNENSGSTTADTSGNGFTGTLVNGASWTSGHSGSAVLFDGTNDKISLPSTFDVTSLPFTFEAWIRPTSRADWRAIFSKRRSYQASNMRFDVGLEISSGRVFVTTARSRVTFPYAPPLNTWTHIAVIADSSGTILYVDGQKHQTLGPVTLGSGSTAPVAIGNTGDGDDPFAGKIDDLRLYDRALSENEIQNDMSSAVR